MRKALFLLTLAISGCATGPDLTIYPEQELVEQRMKMRAGYEGKLTYLVCKARDAVKGDCTQEEIKTVDLTDERMRSALVRMGFVCNISGERFKPCVDSAGFCQITYRKDCFFCSTKEVVAKRLDAVQDFPYLLGAGTRCFQVDKYPFET
jgi:hypothetical protein